MIAPVPRIIDLLIESGALVENVFIEMVTAARRNV